MARLARVVAPGYPHHITQRGNRRQETFFREEDYKLYIELISEFCTKHNVAIWAYCLMPNHVHLIAVPETADGLRRGLGAGGGATTASFPDGLVSGTGVAPSPCVLPFRGSGESASAGICTGSRHVLHLARLPAHSSGAVNTWSHPGFGQWKRIVNALSLFSLPDKCEFVFFIRIVF